MNKHYQLVLAVLALTASVVTATAAEEKPAPKPEPAPVNLPAAATRYLDFYSSAQLNFAIDPDSISIQPGADAEVRYTLKASSKLGATNISYEGIRCSDRHKIIYAIGRSDGSWAMTRDPQWSPIYTRGLNVQHATLANGYFCSVSDVAGKVDKIIRRIETRSAMDDPGK